MGRGGWRAPAAEGRDLPISTADKGTAAGTEVGRKWAGAIMEVVGSLLYLSTHTRLDPAHIAGVQSRYMAKPTAKHWALAKGAVRNLRGTAFGGEHSERGLEGVCRQGFAGHNDDRKSTSAHQGWFNLGRGAVSWGSKKQSTVTCTTETTCSRPGRGCKGGVVVSEIREGLSGLLLGVNNQLPEC